MKNILLFIVIGFSILGCKNDSKKETVAEEAAPIDITKENNGIKQLKGEFIFYEDAAVLQTPTEVYGVVIDSMMYVLQDQVKEYKKEATDMVPVAIKGKITAKPTNEETWPYRVKILEVLKVYKPKAENNNVIKINKQTN